MDYEPQPAARLLGGRRSEEHELCDDDAAVRGQDKDGDAPHGMEIPKAWGSGSGSREGDGTEEGREDKKAWRDPSAERPARTARRDHVYKEGFKYWYPSQFIDMLVKHYKIKPSKVFTRIEFEHVTHSQILMELSHGR